MTSFTHLQLKQCGLSEVRIYKILRYIGRLEALLKVHAHDIRYSELLDEIWNDPSSIPSDDLFDEIDREYQSLPRSIKMKHRPRMPVLSIGQDVKRHIEIKKLLTEILTIRPHQRFAQSVNSWYVEHGDVTNKQLEALRIVHSELQ